MNNEIFELKIDKAYLYDDAILIVNSVEFSPDPKSLKYTKLGIDTRVESVILNTKTKTYTYKLKPNTAGWSDYT